MAFYECPLIVIRKEGDQLVSKEVLSSDLVPGDLVEVP